MIKRWVGAWKLLSDPKIWVIIIISKDLGPEPYLDPWNKYFYFSCCFNCNMYLFKEFFLILGALLKLRIEPDTCGHKKKLPLVPM